MEAVTVRIDVSNQRGRRMIRELYGKKEIEIISTAKTGKPKTGILWCEAYERGLDKLSANYGVDMRELKSKL